MEIAKESSFSFGFSWADEVEREEEQEKEKEKEKEKENRMRIQRERGGAKFGKIVKRRACDPFGAARPREVILEEKGVDWKKLDHDFSFDSSITISIRESKTKVATIKKKPLETQKCRNTLPSQQSVQCEELVPPLKYPPKNIESVFEEIHRARKLLPNTNRNVKTNDQCVENRISKRGSNVKGALKKCPHQPYTAKENTRSNFEAKSVKDEGTKQFERRRVLVELNDASCKDKVPCNSSYFGVLELLEPSLSSHSHEKLNSGICCSCDANSSTSKRGRAPLVSVTTIEEEEEEEEELHHNSGSKLEAGKHNQEKPTVSKRRKGGKKRSKK